MEHFTTCFGTIAWLRPPTEFPVVLDSETPFPMTEFQMQNPLVFDLQELDVPSYYIHPLAPRGVRANLVLTIDQQDWLNPPNREKRECWRAAFAGIGESIKYLFQSCDCELAYRDPRSVPQFIEFNRLIQAGLRRESLRLGIPVSWVSTWDDPLKVICSIQIADTKGIMLDAKTFFSNLARMVS